MLIKLTTAERVGTAKKQLIHNNLRLLDILSKEEISFGIGFANFGMRYSESRKVYNFKHGNFYY